MRIRRIHLIVLLFLFMEVLLGFYVIKYTFRTKQQAWTYQNDDEITCIDTTSTGRFLGIGDRNGSISLVAVGKPTPRWKHRGASAIVSIQVSDVGDYLVTLDSDDKLSFFSQTPRLRDGKIEPLWKYDLPDGEIGGIYSSGEAPALVYVLATSRGNIRLFSKSGEMLWEYPTGCDDVLAALSSDGSRIVSGDTRGNVLLFKVGSATPLWSFSVGSKVVSTAISSDSRYIVVGGVTEGGEGHLYLISLEDGNVIYHQQVDHPIRTVHISYDGGNVVADEQDGTAVILLREEDAFREYTSHTIKGVEMIKFSPFGSYLAATNPNGEIYLHYLPRPAPLWRFRVHDGATSLAMTRRGEYIFVSALDKVYLLSNTRISEMIPGSRIGWAIVFFSGIGMALSSSIVIHGKERFIQIEGSDLIAVLFGFFIGALIGLLLIKDASKAVLICGVGSSIGSIIGWRGKNITSLITGSYLGCFGSGASGYLLGFLIWFRGDERNIIQLTLLHLFNGLKTGALFGPLGAIVGTFILGLIVPKFVTTSR